MLQNIENHKFPSTPCRKEVTWQLAIVLYSDLVFGKYIFGNKVKNMKVKNHIFQFVDFPFIIFKKKSTPQMLLNGKFYCTGPKIISKSTSDDISDGLWFGSDIIRWQKDSVSKYFAPN